MYKIEFYFESERDRENKKVLGLSIYLYILLVCVLLWVFPTHKWIFFCYMTLISVFSFSFLYIILFWLLVSCLHSKLLFINIKKKREIVIIALKGVPSTNDCMKYNDFYVSQFHMMCYMGIEHINMYMCIYRLLWYNVSN